MKRSPLRSTVPPVSARSRFGLRAGTAFALSLLGSTLAVATPTNTFIGGGTANWSDATNWDANGVPVIGGNSTLAIAVNSNGTYNNDLGGVGNLFTLSSLLLNAGSGGYAFGGAALNFAGTSPSITLNNTSAVSLASAISLTSANMTLTGAGTLNLAGAVNGAGSSVATATGQILIAGTNSTVKFSAGANTNLLAITGSGNTVSFLGGTYTFNATDTTGGNNSFRVDSQASPAIATQANIQNGAVVNTVYAYVARAVNSSAGTTVTGAGSSLVASKQIIVGSNAGSQGTLIVSSGGSAQAASLVIGNGAAAGANPNASGTVTVIGNGSTLISASNGGSAANNTGNITVGSAGTGVLTLSGGGSASASGNIFVGNSAGSIGTINVNAVGGAAGGGAVTTLAAAGALIVGSLGSGTLSVQNGGTVTAAATSYIGQGSGQGSVTVNGVGSSIAVTGPPVAGIPVALLVGYSGTGTLTLDTGGTATATNFSLGDLAGGNGTVNVNAAGIGIGGAVTTLSTPGFLLVGNNGTGKLAVQNGGTVTTGSSSAIAALPGSTGTLTVTGAGSSLAVSGQLEVGGQAGFAGGTGQLTVKSEATVSSSSSLILYSGGSLNIDNASVTVGNISIGKQTSGNISIANNGSLTFGGANSSTLYSGVISGSSGTLTKTGTGSTTLSGNSTFTGNTQVSGGTLLVTGSLSAAGQTTVALGTSLSGAGAANNVILSNGGTIAPGNSAAAGDAGTLGATSLQWNPGGTLAFDIGASTDRLNLTGALTKGTAGSGTGFNFSFANNGIVGGQFYDLIQFATVSGLTASDFTETGLAAGTGTFVVDTGLNRVRFLTSAVVPECPTPGLFLAGAVFALPLLRRSRRAETTGLLKGLKK